MNYSISAIRKLRENGQLPVTIRGKEFGLREIRIICQHLESFWDEGRTQISKEVCKSLNWRQPNGWLKDRACRDVLLRMEEMGLFKLPPRMSPGSTGVSKASASTDLEGWVPKSEVHCTSGSLSFTIAKGGKKEEVWNTVVDQYHYLGFTVMVGRCLKYLVTSENIVIAALCFASPAWSVEARDKVLERLGVSELQKHVVNNSRFVVLPHVEGRNLASTILAEATSRIRDDWRDYYSIEPFIAETYVDKQKYDGTCYKAANWVDIGETKGYSKSGRKHENSKQPKGIFLYGLTRPLRRKLTNSYRSTG